MNVTCTEVATNAVDEFTADTVEYEGESAAEQVAVFDKGPGERRYALAEYWVQIS